MTKTIQVRICQADIENAIKEFINKEVSKACKKQKIDEQINIEVDQAVISVDIPDHEQRIKKLEAKVFK